MEENSQMAFKNGSKDSLDFEITDRFYGKEFIKIVQVERNGEDGCKIFIGEK